MKMKNLNLLLILPMSYNLLETITLFRGKICSWKPYFPTKSQTKEKCYFYICLGNEISNLEGYSPYNWLC